MGTETIEVDIKGKRVRLPSVPVCGAQIVVRGRMVKWAYIYGEDWTQHQIVHDADRFADTFRQTALKADILTFAQKVPDTEPHFDHPFVMEDYAVVPISTFDEWWQQRLPHVTRKNVRRAQKRGVSVRRVRICDDVINGIAEIYNDTPVRQGKPFRYYGVDAEFVRREMSEMGDRSELIGCYCGDEMIAFAKIVYMDRVAGLIHLLAKRSHLDKRPNNALIAEAVRICCERGCTYLTYGRYIYGNQRNSSLTVFKERNGFESMKIPRYYIALTRRGRIALALRTHVGLLGLLPSRLLSWLTALRAGFFRSFQPSTRRHGSPNSV